MLTWINVAGVKQRVRAAVGLTVAKMLRLASFVIVGLLFVDSSRVVSFEAPSPGNLGDAALLLLFAYAVSRTRPRQRVNTGTRTATFRSRCWR